MISAYQIPGRIATMRLPRLFEGVALDWFVTKSELDNPHDWEAWKVLIKTQFGTRLWKKKMIKAFESDFFDPMKDKPHKWWLQQKKRIFGQCKGSLEHDIKYRIDMDQDLPHLIAVIEEVIEMKGLNKKFSKETKSVKKTVKYLSRIRILDKIWHTFRPGHVVWCPYKRCDKGTSCTEEHICGGTGLLGADTGGHFPNPTSYKKNVDGVQNLCTKIMKVFTAHYKVAPFWCVGLYVFLAAGAYILAKMTRNM
ncbi:hypothetical protein PPACK8108_LOCUS9184 [Phakopsora pachyrhizi]|uniref:Retrotransposon gag domain-containing protein n=1 Tax=Phakopsora pachyrhizi TaxID=170000 RepID=A0AAV0AW11_PHAPC|nr:hypothetical protein PPACK8108_LOCUS9184 [Phakopsora pachyrhizi]